MTAAATARLFLDVRRERERLLGSVLFGEPAWDILLELFVAEQEGRRSSADEVIGSLPVPPDVAFRWIAAMEAEGHLLLERTGLRLSRPASEAMLRLFRGGIQGDRTCFAQEREVPE